MTNAEKFLKDGVKGIKPLLDKCREIGAIDSGREYRIDQMLREQVKPTLTEDERVILRSVDEEYNYIGKIRYNDNQISLYVSRREKHNAWTIFPHNDLFQFIKERRRI